MVSLGFTPATADVVFVSVAAAFVTVTGATLLADVKYVEPFAVTELEYVPAEVPARTLNFNVLLVPAAMETAGLNLQKIVPVEFAAGDVVGVSVPPVVSFKYVNVLGRISVSVSRVIALACGFVTVIV